MKQMIFIFLNAFTLNLNEQNLLNKFIKVNQETKKPLNSIAINNCSKLKPLLFLFPLFFLITLTLFIYSRGSFNVANYIEIQKDLFIFLNSKFSQFPTTLNNLTQFGNTVIFLSFLTIFVIYAPKVWESLLSALPVSAILSYLLKAVFSVPRPAEALDNNSFVIIGEPLTGFSSLPSGHSITTFTILTVLLFSFMPKKMGHKALYITTVIIIGLIFVLTRIGLGAHYPIDVTVGCIIGYISGLLGIFISRKYKIWNWVNNKKYYPIFILLFLICCSCILVRITHENLIIFYFALISLFISLYKVTTVYVKK